MLSTSSSFVIVPTVDPTSQDQEVMMMNPQLELDEEHFDNESCCLPASLSYFDGNTNHYYHLQSSTISTSTLTAAAGHHYDEVHKRSSIILEDFDSNCADDCSIAEIDHQPSPLLFRGPSVTSMAIHNDVDSDDDVLMLARGLCGYQAGSTLVNDTSEKEPIIATISTMEPSTATTLEEDDIKTRDNLKHLVTPFDSTCSALLNSINVKILLLLLLLVIVLALGYNQYILSEIIRDSTQKQVKLQAVIYEMNSFQLQILSDHEHWRNNATETHERLIQANKLTETLMEDNASLQEYVGQLQGDIDILMNDKKGLQEDYAKLTLKHHETETVKQQLQLESTYLKALKENLNQQIVTLTNDLKETKEEYKAVVKEKNRLQALNEQSTHKIKDLFEKLDAKTKQEHSLQQRIIQLEAELKALRSDNMKLTTASDAMSWFGKVVMVFICITVGVSLIKGGSK